MISIEEELNTKFENKKHMFIANLIFTSNWFKNTVAEYLRPDNLSFQQFTILRTLSITNNWTTMNDIKNLMVEKSPNTTRLANKLVDKGLVERKRSEIDRRIVYLAISEKGTDLLKSIDDRKGSYMDVTNKITEEEAVLVSAILDKIRN